MMIAGLSVVVLLGACKEKAEPKDDAEYVESFEIPRPSAPKSLVQQPSVTAAKWEGVPCVVSISCHSADTLQMVYDEFGQAYLDNEFDVRIMKKDSTNLFRQRLTKQMFLSKMKEDNERDLYARKAVLKSVSAEIDEGGVFHHFNVCLQLPDAVDDDNVLFKYSTNGSCEQVTIDYMHDEDPDEGV